MPRYNIAWDDEYPGGFLSYYGTRRMPKEVHTRLSILARLKSTSIEHMLVKCLVRGLEKYERETYMPEVRNSDGENDS